MKAEYDFTKMRRPVRGKYARAAAKGTNLVLLDPEVARAFPTDAHVNAALKGVLAIAKTIKARPKPASAT